MSNNSIRCRIAEAGLHSGNSPFNHTAGPASYCNICDCHFCDSCWNLQAPHYLNTFSPTGVPHEKTDPNTAAIVKDTFQVSTSDHQQQELHIEDENTTWFGVSEVDGETRLRDYGRYAELMSFREEQCFPALVSFVGPTGAGKSSLIKLLIQLGPLGQEDCETPVIGRANDSLSPTSGDVHLYPDPRSFQKNRPLLYADCEGINGGDRLPKAAQAKLTKAMGRGLVKPYGNQAKHTVVHNFRHVTNRPVKWAKGEELKRREYAVTNLYPRLLYTFADCVVFVLKSQQSIEKVIVQLLDWAKIVSETSSNQPTLPHGIIALNASANQIDSSRWDVSTSTQWLLDEVQPALEQNPDLQRYVRLWREKGLEITSIKTLLSQYYSSFRVVHIPENGRPELIRAQVEKLYGEISTACEESYEKKKKRRMLLSSTDLQSYLGFAFDWYCNFLDRPFDFIQASFANSQTPSDFQSNVTNLAFKLMHANKWTTDTNSMVKPLFEGLSFMVGSCIMLEATRLKLNGLATDIFPRFEASIELALEEFCDWRWPCEWVSPKRHTRCINMKNGHAKGHQLENGRVYSGEYQSTFSSESYHETFRGDVFNALAAILKEVQDEHQRQCDALAEDQVAALIHKSKTLQGFYTKLGVSQRAIVSHTMCLVCLMRIPEHRLPCGHIICTPCLRAYGRMKGDILIEISSCPMPHKPELWNTPWPVAVKPATAGVRILSLDGGGVRGIVELEILNLIQSKLPPVIPISSFLDLIVGTSTGGLVALGLVAKAWTTETCTQHFNDLCEEAFQPRTQGNWGSIGTLWDAYNHSKYKTQPLEKALKKAYCSSVQGNDYIFGGTNTTPCPSTKLAVVTTSVSGDPIVISNYNRASTENVTYKFLRQDNPRNELELWEVARATSAAPGYFRSYHHSNTKQLYEDGALYHNNPVYIADSERKLIWSDIANAPPDIILSIGTGHNPNREAEPPNTPMISRPPKRGLVTHFQNFKRIGKDHFTVSLDSERTWANWFQTISRPPDYQKRFLRLNVTCEEGPPHLDDIPSMPQLRKYVQEQFGVNQSIEQVAHQLIASSFYVAKTSSVPDIRCRLTLGEIQGLGHWLQSRFVTESQHPYFIVRNINDEDTSRKILLTDDVLQVMTKSSHFSIPLSKTSLEPDIPVDILFCLEEYNPPREYMISGFPRSLDDSASPGPRSRSPVPTYSASTASRKPRNTGRAPVSELDKLRRLTSIENWNPLPASELNKSEPPIDVQDAHWSASTWSEVLESKYSGELYEMPDTSIETAESDDLPSFT